MLKKFCDIFIISSLLGTVGCGAEEPKKPRPFPIPLPLPLPEPEPLPKEPEPEPKEPEIDSCVKSGADFTRDGGYRVRQKRVGRVVVYEPSVSGCKMPVYNHCNGTGAQTFFYRPQMQRMASHGYLAVSYETPQSGSGREALQAIEIGLKRDDTLSLVATGGHSQGGQCAASSHFLLEQKYSESVKVVSIHEEPAYSMSRPTYAREIPQLKGSSFVIHGTRDTVVPKSWVSRGARLLKNDHYWYAANGATHMNVQGFAATGSLAFANWKLLGYEDAKRFFLEGMPAAREWSVVEKSPKGYGFNVEMDYDLILKEEYELYR